MKSVYLIRWVFHFKKLLDIGSTIGGLLGRSFQRSGKEMQGKRNLDARDLTRMMNVILSSIQEKKSGDKTLVDALEPAVTAANTAIQSGEKDVQVVLRKMAIAAEEGAKSTTDMVSRIGRSRGTTDPGADLIAILLTAMSDFSSTHTS
jgi:dihydroxyacetone kinase-like protein